MSLPDSAESTCGRYLNKERRIQTNSDRIQTPSIATDRVPRHCWRPKELQIMNRRLLLVSRRSFLSASSLLVAPAVARADVVRASFPMHEPELVEEVVGVSHGNLARVKELVGRQPAL